MWAFAYGASQRHNDLGFLNLSALPDQVLEYFIENDVSLGEDGDEFVYPAMYGDGIYHNTLVVTGKIESAVQGSVEELINKRMNCGRESVEHGFGDLGEHFKLLKVKKKFSVFKNGKEMHALVMMTMFIQNIYTCFNGNKVMTQHKAEQPSLDFYLPLDENLEIIEW